MTHPTKLRTGTLDDIAAGSHVFSIIAMDQRNTLRRMFTAVGLDASDDDLRTAKADVARVLTPAASGLLSDPTYGVPAITAAHALAANCGLLVAAEPSERRSYRGEPRTHRDPGLDAQWVFDQGGDALKFFVQLRADRPAPAKGEPDLVAETLAVCQEIIDDCRAKGVPVVIENLIYELPGEELRGKAREDSIIEAARALNNLDIDLLKLEYPGSAEGCRRLAAVLDRPWAVLSAGVPFDQFTDVIQIAFEEGGASGFIAGRSVWREVVSLAGQEREQFLTSVALPRLRRLVAVAERLARPWTEMDRASRAITSRRLYSPVGPERVWSGNGCWSGMEPDVAE
jgi:tagatose 1,6-diphosphate aldolase/sulfofructosephosphate aldolase